MKQLYFRCMLTLLLTISGNYISANTVDEVFQSFKTAYEKSKNFSADFEETTFRAGNKNVARGRVAFSKPNLLRKEYVSQKDPTQLAQLIILDGEYSWSYTPLLNQVNKMRWNKSNRKELLPGVGASLEDVQKNYDIKLVADAAANAKGVYRIELTPKPHMIPGAENGAVPPREILEVWVQSDEWLPVQFGYRSESDDENDMSVIVSLANIQRDQEVGADTFKFVIPDGVEVIDLSPDE
jgi:outer membrane lipoprotein-sorting protein